MTALKCPHCGKCFLDSGSETCPFCGKNLDVPQDFDLPEGFEIFGWGKK